MSTEDTEENPLDILTSLILGASFYYLVRMDLPLKTNKLVFKNDPDSIKDSRAGNPSYKRRVQEKHTNKVGIGNILKRNTNGKFC